MSYSVPITRQVSWLAVLPQLASLAAAVAIGYTLGGPEGVTWGAAGFLAYSTSSRLLIARTHRAGIKLVNSHRFEDAIAKFQESFEFFERHSWIDRFRSITLMTPSAASYREMALANIAFCYGQIGNGEQCRSYYQRCLDRYPNSGLATVALRMLDSAVPAPARQ